MLDFIKLYYMNMPYAWPWEVSGQLLSEFLSAVKSSLVEGHVPQKSSVYPSGVDVRREINPTSA